MCQSSNNKQVNITADGFILDDDHGCDEYMLRYVNMKVHNCHTVYHRTIPAALYGKYLDLLSI